MNTTRNNLTALFAAGTPGVALFTLTNLIPVDLALAGLTTIGLFAFAVYDFSRNTAPLRVRAAILRPPLHATDHSGSNGYRKAA